MILFKFKPKFSLVIILTFIVFTVIGTLTHELGHISVAKFFGYETTLHYGSMEYVSNQYNADKDVILFDELNNKLIEKYKDLTFEDVSESEKEEINLVFERIKKKFPSKEKDSFYVNLGGPLQTVLTCFIGLYILWRRESKDRYTFNKMDWLGVFLGLFILREVYNTVVALFLAVFFNRNEFYGDEFDISLHLGLNQWVVPIITTIVGLLIALYIILKVIPERFRFSFIISGFIGGTLGYFLWFRIIGPIVLP